MFPESKWVVDDLLNQYVSDEDGQRSFREYLDELSLEESLEGIHGALGRLDRALERLDIVTDSQEPLSEEPVNQEPVNEEPVEQDPDDGNNVVEDSEQKKVDTSESKLQKLLANVLKK